MTLNKPQGLPVTGTGSSEGSSTGFGGLRGNGEQALSSGSDPAFALWFSRKTRRADFAVRVARAEPGPGAQAAGAAGCPSTWEVSAGGSSLTGDGLSGRCSTAGGHHVGL